MEMSGQPHGQDVLPPEKGPPFPVDRRLDGPLNWSEHCKEESKWNSSWRALYCGILHCFVRWKLTNISEEHVAYICRSEEYAKRETSM
jgi:hypothetical protein